MSIDVYHGRVYIPKVYTCYHFVAEVLMDVSGRDLSKTLEHLFNTGKLSREHVRQFTEVQSPQENCIVIMQRPNVNPPHMGIYIRKKVLHLHRKGVEYQPIDVASRGFPVVRFAICN